MRKFLRKLIGNEYWPSKSVKDKISDLRRDTIYLEKRMDWLVRRVDKLEGRSNG